MYRNLTPSQLGAVLDSHREWVTGEGGARECPVLPDPFRFWEAVGSKRVGL